MEWMVVTNMQRKVHTRTKSKDEYTKVNGRIIKIIFKKSFKKLGIEGSFSLMLEIKRRYDSKVFYHNDLHGVDVMLTA